MRGAPGIYFPWGSLFVKHSIDILDSSRYIDLQRGGQERPGHQKPKDDKMRVFSENYKDKRPNGETIVRTRWVVEWANGFRVFSTQRSANQFASEAA